MPSNNYASRFRFAYLRATSQQYTDGVAWYPRARTEMRALAERYGLPVHVVAGVTAALSNCKTWAENLRLTQRVLFDHNAGRPLHGHFTLCLRAARRVLDTGDVTALGGPKVVAFARALAGDDTVAVIDRHMVRAAGRRKSLTAKGHRELQSALRAAARGVGMPVTHFQAVVWVTVRGAA